MSCVMVLEPPVWARMVLFLYSTGAYWLATTWDNVVKMTSNSYNICEGRFMCINIITFTHINCNQL